MSSLSITEELIGHRRGWIVSVGAAALERWRAVATLAAAAAKSELLQLPSARRQCIHIEID
jgi:hypothetical protein